MSRGPESEPHLRSLAERAAAAAPIVVIVHPSTADRLPVADDSVDSAVLFLVLCSLNDGSDDKAMSSRADVVMPFDLATTTHTFTKTPDGGIEQVVASSPTDTPESKPSAGTWP